MTAAQSRIKRLFILIVILVPLLFLFVLEGSLRLIDYGGDLSLFVPARGEDAGLLTINPNVGQRYFGKQKTIPSPTKDLFLEEKPEKGYRIFVMGGSSAAGYPYGNNLKFSRILAFRLQEMYPEKTIEVVNVALSAVGSYTLLDFTDEVLEQEPDAILIYAGHNEYYGALGVASMESFGRKPWLVRSYLRLNQFRTFRLMRNMVQSIRGEGTTDQLNSASQDPTGTLMERIVGEQNIPTRSKLYEEGRLQFESNLSSIIDLARGQNVEVILSELVSNIKDQAPFVSLENNNEENALYLYQQAQKYEQASSYSEARAAYTLAKNHDALRFRASEDINEIIHALARENELLVVPMLSAFEKEATNGLVGNELMVDHLHPNMDGYFLMADAFFKTLVNNRVLDAPRRGVDITDAHGWKSRWAISCLDSTVSDLNIMYLKGGWPFKAHWEPNRSLETYKNNTPVKDLALKVLTNPELGLEQAHVLLAAHYRSLNDKQRAAEEYLALIYSIPFELSFYQEALKLLLAEKQYGQARQVLEIAYYYGHDQWAIQWLGQVELWLGDIEQAIASLEQAKNRFPEDAAIITNLYRAYIQVGSIDRAKSLAGEIEVKFPDSKVAKKLKGMQSTVQRLASERTRKLLEKAQTHLQAQEYKQAEDLLLRTLEIQATPTAYRWLGQMAQNQNRVGQATKYYEAGLALQPKDNFMSQALDELRSAK